MKQETESGLVPATIVSDLRAAEPSTLAALVRVANGNHDRFMQAGRALVAFSCIVGAAVEHAYQLAAKNRLNIKPLFKNYWNADTKAARLSGGAAFNFTYEHGNKCRKLFNGVYDKMIASGQYTPEGLNRIIGEHVAALMSGGVDSQQTLALFDPFLQTDNLRQELLALFPQPAPTVGEQVAAAVEQTPALPLLSWEAQREQHKTDFLGYLTCIDTYIEQACSYTTAEDREEQARKLEAAAQKLRAAHTQPDLPGLI